MNIRLFLFFMLLGCTGSSSTRGFLPLNRFIEDSPYRFEDSNKRITLEKLGSLDKGLLRLKFTLLENFKSYYIYSCPTLDSTKLSNYLIRKLKYEEIEQIKKVPQDDLYIKNNYIIYSIKNFDPNMCYKVKVELGDNEVIFSNDLDMNFKNSISQKSFASRLDLNKDSQANFSENLSFLDEESATNHSYKNFVDEGVKREIFRVSLKLKSKSDEEIREKIFELIRVMDKKSLELRDILNEESYEMENTPNFLGLNIVANKGLINNTIIPALDEIKKLSIDTLSREKLEKTCIKLIILKIEIHTVERSPTKSARSRPIKRGDSLKIISLNKTSRKEEELDEERILRRGISEDNIVSSR